MDQKILMHTSFSQLEQNTGDGVEPGVAFKATKATTQKDQNHTKVIGVSSGRQLPRRSAKGVDEDEKRRDETPPNFTVPYA